MGQKRVLECLIADVNPNVKVRVWRSRVSYCLRSWWKWDRLLFGDSVGRHPFIYAIAMLRVLPLSAHRQIM